MKLFKFFALLIFVSFIGMATHAQVKINAYFDGGPYKDMCVNLSGMSIPVQHTPRQDTITCTFEINRGSGFVPFSDPDPHFKVYSIDPWGASIHFNGNAAAIDGWSIRAIVGAKGFISDTTDILTFRLNKKVVDYFSDTASCYPVTLDFPQHQILGWTLNGVDTHVTSLVVSTTAKVALYLFDSTQSDCPAVDTIRVTIEQVGHVRGKVTASTGQGLSTSKLLMIRHNPIDSTIVAVDSVLTDQHGNFSMLAHDSIFYLKAIPDSSAYPNQIPTYSDTTAFFVNAKPFYLDCDSITIVNFSTLAGANPGGPGFIGGTISQGANKKKGVGDPVTGVRVVLMNANKEPVAFGETDADGKFSFSNLSTGKYYFFVDDPKIQNGIAPSLEVTSAAFQFPDLSFVLNSDHLVLESISGIEAAEATFSIHPNPFRDFIVIDTPNDLINRVEVYGMDGRLYFAKEIKGSANGRLNIDLSNLEVGSYILLLKSNSQVYRQQIKKID
ncbi:MAG: T9SS type A sorting domain-containing protein [Bacteroidia bacterium]